MALPRKLKHLNLFNDGNNWQGIVESLTLPKFTRKYEKYRGGGMPGAVDVDLGLDDSALDTEFSIGGTELLLFKQMGKATVDGIQLRFTGSIQRDDTGEVQAVELVVRGRHKEVDSGEWKTGESNTTKVTSTNSYAKLTINGEVLYEVDLIASRDFLTAAASSLELACADRNGRVSLSTALRMTCRRRLLSLIVGPASLNRFIPPFQHFGQRHNVSNGWRPVKNGGDICHQIVNRQAVGKPASTDFFNKKVTTSTDMAVRSAGSISAISCAVSAGLEMRGITVIIAFTSISIMACRRVPRSAPDCGLRSTISVISVLPRLMGVSS